MSIKTISIQNFKSIRKAEIEMKPINILIGANGVGKSNFISFLKFVNQIILKKLEFYVAKNGRADNFLYFGSKKSAFLSGKISFDNKMWQTDYEFNLVMGQLMNFVFENEVNSGISPQKQSYSNRIEDKGQAESNLNPELGGTQGLLFQALSSFKIFHFHDTSFNAKVKQPCTTTDYAYFQEDGGNLAAFLYKLSIVNPQNFKMIERVIRSIAPFFEGFYLTPDEINEQQIFLRWREKDSEQLFTAHNFSDGTLRMICLATLLLQPTPPDTIIIDEPELGLHPFAISKLAGLIKSAATTAQVIISTQSVEFINQFEADDIIVVERNDGQTTFQRQSNETLAAWLEDYAIGELWQKNIIGGRPK
jgi:predicted ATPase